MVQAGQGRDAVKASVLAKVEAAFARWDQVETIIDDQEKKYVAKQTWGEDGVPVTLVKWSAAGVTMEQVQRVIDDPFAIGPVMNNKMSYEMLPESEGNPVAHIKAKMPMMISNRSVVSCLYREEREGGEKLMFHSSEGNDEVVAGRATQIGSDVVANMIFAYWSFKPIEGGLQITMAQSMDPAGMIPGFIKTKMAKRGTSAPQLLIDYLVNGTVPESVF